jgi:hypothetical protein
LSAHSGPISSELQNFVDPFVPPARWLIFDQNLLATYICGCQLMHRTVSAWNWTPLKKEKDEAIGKNTIKHGIYIP